MSVRWFTFVLWAAVAASAVAWGLKLFVTAPPMPREARVADAGQALRGDVTRVLGADAPPPVATEAAPAPVTDARFQLVGVVAPRSPQAAREGLALIAVDGKPPKAFRVGAAVEGTTVVKAVRARGADLGPRDGAVTIALQIPPPAPAATGTLPAAGAAAPAVFNPAMPNQPPPPPMAQPGLPGLPPPVRSKALPVAQPGGAESSSMHGGDINATTPAPEGQAVGGQANSSARMR